MRTTCSDCPKIPLESVRILDYATNGQRSGLSYALPEAKTGWTGLFPVAGEIHAWLCPECHRVYLFAFPKPDPALKGAVSIPDPAAGDLSEPDPNAGNDFGGVTVTRGRP